jgi:hypothetical protein
MSIGSEGASVRSLHVSRTGSIRVEMSPTDHARSAVGGRADPDQSMSSFEALLRGSDVDSFHNDSLSWLPPSAPPLEPAKRPGGPSNRVPFPVLGEHAASSRRRTWTSAQAESSDAVQGMLSERTRQLLQRVREGNSRLAAEDYVRKARSTAQSVGDESLAASSSLDLTMEDLVRRTVPERRGVSEVERLKPLEAEVSRLRSALDARESEVDQLGPLEAEVERLKPLEAEVERLKPLEAEVERLKPLEAEVSRLRSALDAHEEGRTESAATAARIRSLREQLQVARELADARDSENASLKTEAAQQAGRFAMLHQNLSALARVFASSALHQGNEWARILRRVGDGDTIVDNLDAVSGALDELVRTKDTIGKLKSELDSLRAAMHKLEAERAAWNEEKLRLRRDLETGSHLSESLHASQSTVTLLQQQLEVERKASAAKLAALEMRVNEYREAALSARAEADAAVSAHSQELEQRESSESLLMELNSRVASLSASNKALSDRDSSLNDELALTRKALQAVESSTEGYRRQATILRGSLEASQEQVRRLTLMLVNKTGREPVVLEDSRPLPDEAGTMTTTMVVAEDGVAAKRRIDELQGDVKRLQDQLRELAEGNSSDRVARIQHEADLAEAEAARRGAEAERGELVASVIRAVNLLSESATEAWSALQSASKAEDTHSERLEGASLLETKQRLVGGIISDSVRSALKDLVRSTHDSVKLVPTEAELRTTPGGAPARAAALDAAITAVCSATKAIAKELGRVSSRTLALERSLATAHRASADVTTYVVSKPAAGEEGAEVAALKAKDTEQRARIESLERELETMHQRLDEAVSAGLKAAQLARKKSEVDVKLGTTVTARKPVRAPSLGASNSSLKRSASTKSDTAMTIHLGGRQSRINRVKSERQ